MKNIRSWIAALCAALSLNAHAGLYTDLWYNPQESGWGVNIVQQLETAFVTLFVYGPDGKPTWYVAPDAHVIAYAGALPLFVGTLYRTRGPWHGGPFDPVQVDAVAVGTLSLEVRAKNRIRVEYSAEGSSITKDVVRQTWAEPLHAVNFFGAFRLRQSGAANGPNIGTLEYSGDIFLHLDAGVAFMRVDDLFGRRCEYRGTHEQAGKIATLAGNFACSAGRGGFAASAGTFTLTDFEVSDHGITGRLVQVSPGLYESGRLAAVQM
jgi:hypothetical protein